MTTTIASTDIVVSVEPLFTAGERSALAGFLAGYSGLTRDAYALDLRMFTAWCQQHALHLRTEPCPPMLAACPDAQRFWEGSARRLTAGRRHRSSTPSWAALLDPLARR